jgi:hypothetical protein
LVVDLHLLIQSVAITTNIYEFNSQPWKCAVDTNLCDNSLSVTGGNFIHIQVIGTIHEMDKIKLTFVGSDLTFTCAL